MYELILNEVKVIDSNTAVIRVPGGWVYETRHGVVFIPFNNEFNAAIDDLEDK